MSELSPAAQAVDDAFWKIINDKWNIYDRRRAQIAAALRAAVAHTQQHHNHDVWKCDADELLAIADELEAQ
jgi:hypothetical protein